MIQQILIEEGGLTSSYLKAQEKAKKLCEEVKENLLIIPTLPLIHDRFINKTYGIYAICTNNSDIKRIKLFMENFAIDYQYKLLERNFPENLSE